METQQPFGRARVTALALAITAALCGSLSAGNTYAQQQPAQPQAAPPSNLEEVTVTGTRIRRDDFNSATPTTVVDAEYMQNLGLINLSDAITQMPSNVSSFQATTTGGGNNFFIGSTIANLRGLNPFFGSRTLTLVDSRRHVPTNQGDGVDLNFIPSVLIDRLEVVTGGASAAYGSGAIGGVTNILLNRGLDGAKLQLDFGQTGEGDGDNKHLGFAYGTDAGESGHFVFAIESQRLDAIDHCSKVRDWCAQGWGEWSNNANVFNPFLPPPAPGTVNLIDPTLPERNLSPNIHAWQVTPGGVFQNTGLQVNAAGTGTLPFNNGLHGAFFQGTVGGDARQTFDQTSLRANVDRDVAYASYTLDISDNLNMFVEGSVGHVETTNIQGGLDSNFVAINADNAFIQGNAALMAARAAGQLFPGGFAFFNKEWDSQTDTMNATQTDLTRFAVGFNGDFGESTWGWESYFQYGDSEREQFIPDNIHLNQANYALDSVIDTRPGSATLGQPVCRVTVTGVGAPGADPRLATGCVPLNPFGTQPLSAAARAYAWGFLRENTEVEQQVVAFTASGDVAEGWAGAIKAAAGVEFRTESIANLAPPSTEVPDYIRTDFLIQYGESFSGDVDVTEVFGEIDIPIAQRFDLNAAVRQSTYDNTGKAGTTGEKRSHDVSTWKISGNWDVVDNVRIRFSQSRDIRAANFRELYYGQIINAGGIFGFCNNYATGNNMDPCTWTLAGNVNLKPEEADTTTFGLVVSVGDTGFRFAADYYEIDISDSISQASVFLVQDGCRDRIAAMCALLNWNLPTAQRNALLRTPGDPLSGFTDIITLRAESFNYQHYKTTGVDLTADWSKQFDSGSGLSVRLIASRAFDQMYATLANTAGNDVQGMTGPNTGFLADFASSPDWLGNLITTWNLSKVTLTGQLRYTSSGKLDWDAYGPEDVGFSLTRDESITTNRVPSHYTVNLTGSYDFDLSGDKTLQVYGVVNNLFDEDPPIAPTGTGGTNPVFFDTIGRDFQLGVRMSF